MAAVFGGLLVEADPVFGRLVEQAIDLDLDPLISHGAVIVLWAWLACGLLRALCRPAEAPSAAPRGGGRFGLGEVGTVLAVVDLLFLAFVAVQFRYLFGGAELVRELTGLSYAEYARRGFFELVAVAALSLPLLLLADWSLDQRDAVRVRRFRQLAGLMLLLLDVMLASALFRMRLYTAEYGLTELRFYTTAFMGWLVLVFGWFVATVLRGRRERFGTGALLAGWLLLAGLNLANPDAIIARVNLERAALGRPLDGTYAVGLSADALPVLRRGLATLGTPEACAAASALEQRWRRELATKRRWTIALARASRVAPRRCAREPGRLVLLATHRRDRCPRPSAAELTWSYRAPLTAARSASISSRSTPAPCRKLSGNPSSPARSVARSRHDGPWWTTASSPRARARSSQAAMTVRPSIAPDRLAPAICAPARNARESSAPPRSVSARMVPSSTAIASVACAREQPRQLEWLSVAPVRSAPEQSQSTKVV